MKKYLFPLIGSVFICISGCLIGLEEEQSLSERALLEEGGHKDSMVRPRVIVFDFGKVMGGSVRGKLVEAVQRELKISQETAAELVEDFAIRSGSKKAFWKEYAKKGVLPDDWRKRYKKIKLESIDLNRAVLKIAEELRACGYRLAVLSNTTKDRAERIRSLGAYDLFDPVVLSFEIGASKPSKAAYEELLRQAKVSAKECLFVDDKLSNTRAAAKMGFDVILFTSAEQLRAELEKRSIFTPGGNISEP